MTALPAGLADLVSELGWHGWQASVTGIVALGIAMLIRRRSPVTAAVIVALALVKFLMPPVVRFPFAFGDTAAVVFNPFGLVPSGQAASDPARTALALVALGSFVISGLFALGVVRHAARVRRILRTAHPVTEGAAARALSAAADALRLRSRPVLLISDVAEGPFATGVLRPAIVLPRTLASTLEGTALNAVIGHELAHHRRRDLPIGWICAAATAVFWFSPVVWMLARLLRELREECCDAAVIRCGLSAPAAYAEALLSAATVTGGPAALPIRDRHPLGRRLRRVLSPPPSLPSVAAAAVVLIFVLLWMPSTTFTPPWNQDGEIAVLRVVDDRSDVRRPAVERVIHVRR